MQLDMQISPGVSCSTMILQIIGAYSLAWLSRPLRGYISWMYDRLCGVVRDSPSSAERPVGGTLVLLSLLLVGRYQTTFHDSRRRRLNTTTTESTWRFLRPRCRRVVPRVAAVLENPHLPAYGQLLRLHCRTCFHGRRVIEHGL